MFRRVGILLALSVALACGGGGGGFFGGAAVTILEDYPGHTYLVSVECFSPDGTKAGGASNGEIPAAIGRIPVIWTGGVPQAINSPSPATEEGSIKGLSTDGSRYVMRTEDGEGTPYAFDGTDWIEFPDATGYTVEFIQVRAVSHNARNVAGWLDVAGGPDVGYHWDVSGALTMFGPFRTMGISPDGSEVLGSKDGLPTIWSNGVFTQLDPLPESTPNVNCYVGDRSTNGIYVGASTTKVNNQNVQEAVRWVNGEPQPLGWLGVGILDSSASFVSADGSTVLGMSRTSSTTPSTGFIWTAATGIKNLRDYVPADLLVSVTSISPRGISDDGKKAVVHLSKSSESRSVIITLP